MFSLENFYYILYTNLFKPARITATYFYPFGSVDPAQIKIFDRSIMGQDNPTICNMLFYDQEPLIDNLVRPAIDTLLEQKFKRLQILVNSEHSEYKNAICKENNLSDLYYFFHGIVANIWYRDFKYLNINKPWTKVFLSLNHLVTNDRSYRLTLLAHLIDNNLLSKGDVSFHIKNNDKFLWETEINNPSTKLSRSAQLLIKKTLPAINQSLILDTSTPEGSMSANVGPVEIDFQQNSFFHVVTETVFYYKKLHLTEKIFKPIVSKRPFILVAAPGNLAYLKSYGFKTFDKWIDESYDNEQDHDRRLELIINEIKKLCSMPDHDLRIMHNEMTEILEYNFNHFFNDFKKIVIHEFLINFETCMRKWNNGRVDDRSVNINDINFTNIEKLLLS